MKKIFVYLLIFFAWSIPSFFAIHNIIIGNIAFWYDPARDMLSGWNNLSKITLIGSTTGIPGIFYGPYWIWWLSFAEFFSKDPRFIYLLTTTIPYLIFLPLILMYFKKIFGKIICISLWLLFVFNFKNYITGLWNPNLAPLLFLVIIYLLISISYEKLDKKSIVKIIASGLLTGLVLNIHISFSVGFAIGVLLFIIFYTLLFSKFSIKERFFSAIKFISLYILSIIVVFWPYIIFELRHQFLQTHTLFNAILHQGAVVSITGLTKTQIITNYFERFGQLLSLSLTFSMIFFVITLVLIIFLTSKHKIFFSNIQKKLIIVLVTITIGVLTIYLSAKNPVWDYHFIGAEIICLLAIGLIAAKIKYLKYILFIWSVYLAIVGVVNYLHYFSINPINGGSLMTEEFIVHTIATDGDSTPYSVYAYSPSIYTYEYDYLFRWLVHKDVSYDPSMIEKEKIVYLILPETKKNLLDDFINFRTPSIYKTSKTWKISDGTVILKKIQITTK